MKWKVFSQILNKKLITHTHKQDMLIIIGDWSVQVRNKAELNFRRSRLGVRKEADELMDFCKANDTFITETCFKQLNRGLPLFFRDLQFSR